MGYLAYGRRQGIVQDQQVVVGIERKSRWVEGARRLTWCLDKFFCKDARNKTTSSEEKRALDDITPIGKGKTSVHEDKEPSLRVLGKKFFFKKMKLFSKNSLINVIRKAYAPIERKNKIKLLCRW